MPYTHEFDPGARLVLLRAEGIVDLQISLEAIAAMAEDSRLQPGYAILVDMRLADYTPSLADARRLTDLQGLTELLKRHPLAFVTATPAHFAAANLVAMLASLKGATAKAFQQYEAATAWLAGKQAGS
jgi:hypothetical protein